MLVTAVDTDNDVVHLNDSGLEDAADEQLSIEDFESAWRIDGHQLFVATE